MFYLFVQKFRKIYDPADHEQPPTKRRKRNTSPEDFFSGKSVVCSECGVAVTKSAVVLKCSDCSRSGKDSDP